MNKTINNKQYSNFNSQTTNKYQCLKNQIQNQYMIWKNEHFYLQKMLGFLSKNYQKHQQILRIANNLLEHQDQLDLTILKLMRLLVKKILYLELKYQETTMIKT